MSQPRLATILAAALLALACGGRGSKPGPTEPEVPILGTWIGSQIVGRLDGSSMSCDLTFDFTQQPQDFSGTYTVVCAGSREDGVVAARLVGDQLFFNAIIRTANSAHPPLDACPWGGQLTQFIARLKGNWAGGGCNSSTIAGGSIDVSKSGG